VPLDHPLVRLVTQDVLQHKPVFFSLEASGLQSASNCYGRFSFKSVLRLLSPLTHLERKRAATGLHTVIKQRQLSKFP
jgi:hypothetical protein